MHRLLKTIGVVTIVALTLAAVAESAQADNLPDQTVCKRALNIERSGWAKKSFYAEEAARRGLTVDACRQLIGTSESAVPQTSTDYRYQARVAQWNEIMQQASRSQTWKRVFHCDYTSKLCMRGFYNVSGITIITSISVYEIIDDKDRETVLERVWCEGYKTERCRFVGSGKITSNGREVGTW